MLQVREAAARALGCIGGASYSPQHPGGAKKILMMCLGEGWGTFDIATEHGGVPIRIRIAELERITWQRAGKCISLTIT